MALAAAERALWLSNPNPRVGCVITADNGTVLGEGHTQRAGGPHAEVVALRDAAARGHSVQGATAWVTLIVNLMYADPETRKPAPIFAGSWKRIGWPGWTVPDCDAMDTIRRAAVFARRGRGSGIHEDGTSCCATDSE